uniref:Uncharacterized protein n=1 Tax=Anguilla anguilla TaxID=7936 RepID=A0A0E9SJ10_ANGAN
MTLNNTPPLGIFEHLALEFVLSVAKLILKRSLLLSKINIYYFDSNRN